MIPAGTCTVGRDRILVPCEGGRLPGGHDLKQADETLPARDRSAETLSKHLPDMLRAHCREAGSGGPTARRLDAVASPARWTNGETDLARDGHQPGRSE